MNLIDLAIPADLKAKVLYSSLYDEQEAVYLTQDILAVSLQGGACVDVGWYPQFDPNGHFCVRVYRDEWENQLAEPYWTRDAAAVVRKVQELAAKYSPPRHTSLSWKADPVSRLEVNNASKTNYAEWNLGEREIA